MFDLLYFFYDNFWLILILSLIAFNNLPKIFSRYRVNGFYRKLSQGMLWFAVVMSFLSLAFLDLSSRVDSCVEDFDFENAHKWLERMKKEDYLSEEENSFWSFLYKYDEKGYYLASEYLVKKFDLLDAETSYLLNLGDEESLGRIISVMYNLNIDYSPYIGVFSAFNDKSREYRIMKRCEDEIMRYNRKCDILLNKAINNKNVEFAESIISLYKENIVISITDYNFFSNNTYSVSLSRKDIDNAKLKLSQSLQYGW